TESEEKRSKQKDDAVVVDHDFKMAQLWTCALPSTATGLCGEEKQLTHENFTASDARWSPDGSRITFTSNPTPLLDDITEQTAWIMDAAGGKPRKLVDTADKTRTVRWSPDGKWIAYLASASGFFYKVSLMVADSSGASPRNLTASFDLNAAQPNWSRDGKHIFFSSDDRESGKIFAADVQSAGVRALVEKEAVLELADTSSDGKVAVGTWTDPLRPPEIFRSDLSFNKIDRITDHNPWLS